MCCQSYFCLLVSTKCKGHSIFHHGVWYCTICHTAQRKSCDSSLIKQCAYSKFGHHPHPLGYLCAEFCFFRDPHCWACLWRKIAYSIILSLSDAQWNKAFASEPVCPTLLHIRSVVTCEIKLFQNYFSVCRVSTSTWNNFTLPCGNLPEII